MMQTESVFVLLSAYYSSWLVFTRTFSTNRLYHAIEVENTSHRDGGQHKYHAIK